VVADDDTSPLATISGTAGDVDAWLWHRGQGRVEPLFDGDDATLDELRRILAQPLN
jgi:hypothetical protein